MTDKQQTRRLGRLASFACIPFYIVYMLFSFNLPVHGPQVTYDPVFSTLTAVSNLFFEMCMLLSTYCTRLILFSDGDVTEQVVYTLLTTSCSISVLEAMGPFVNHQHIERGVPFILKAETVEAMRMRDNFGNITAYALWFYVVSRKLFPWHWGILGRLFSLAIMVVLLLDLFQEHDGKFDPLVVSSRMLKLFAFPLYMLGVGWYICPRTHS